MMAIRLLVISVLAGWLTVPLVGQELYELDHLAEIRIDFAEKNWHEQLDSLKERGEDERLIADITLDGEAYPSSGIRYKGNSSYFNVRNEGYRKLPFNIKVDFKKKKQKLPGGFSTLKLSNVFRDPSFLREVLSYQIAADYMASPRANFAKVFVNGDYLGLYNLTQSIDDDLLEVFFGEDDGTLIKCDPNWHMDRMSGCPTSDKASLQYLGQDTICYRSYYEMKSKGGGWGQLAKLTYIINKSPSRLPEILNIDEALWMLAYNNVLVNLDSYTGHLCHNYYLYQDTFGIFHPMVWDMNLNFGGFRYTGLGSPLSNEKLQTLSPLVHFQEKNEKRPLILTLLGESLYRKIYLAHMRTILDDYFVNDRYLELAKEVRDMIGEEVEADENKLYTLENYQENLTETVRLEKGSIIGVQELMEARTEYLINHPLLSHEAPVLGEVTDRVQGDSVTVSVSVTGADQVWLYHRDKKYAPFIQVAMTAQDETAEGKTVDWSVALPLEKIKHYYLVAEDKQSARLSPTKAAFEFYELVVK